MAIGLVGHAAGGQPPGARAVQEPARYGPPHDAVAWWSFDFAQIGRVPGTREQVAAWIGAAARAHERTGLLTPGEAGLLARVLATAADSGARAHVALLGPAPGERAARLAVLVSGITPEAARALLGEPRPGEDARPAGVHGGGGGAAILLGGGDLRSGADGGAPWDDDRRAAAGRDPGQGPILEVYADLNAARRLWPEGLGGGPVARALTALRLANARSVLLRAELVAPERVATRDPAIPRPPALRGRAETAYTGPPLLAVRVAWSSRSERPGTLHALALTEAFWPADELGRPGAGVLAAVVRPRVLEWAALAGDLARAGIADAQQRERFELDLARWARRAAPALQRSERSLGPWMVLELAEPDGAPIRLVGVVGLRGRDAAGRGPARDLAEAFSEAGPSLRPRREADGFALALLGAGRAWWRPAGAREEPAGLRLGVELDPGALLRGGAR
ncbi:MAG TPA: hypothetical protein VD963_06210 [Phycisphaerales bacterium]|nr:hypothetical protein [Phycisphaerales bacterium]